MDTENLLERNGQLMKEVVSRVRCKFRDYRKQIEIQDGGYYMSPEKHFYLKDQRGLIFEKYSLRFLHQEMLLYNLTGDILTHRSLAVGESDLKAVTEYFTQTIIHLMDKALYNERYLWVHYKEEMALLIELGAEREYGTVYHISKEDEPVITVEFYETAISISAGHDPQPYTTHLESILFPAYSLLINLTVTTFNRQDVEQWYQHMKKANGIKQQMIEVIKETTDSLMKDLTLTNNEKDTDNA